MDTETEARIAALESRCADMVARWNDFVTRHDGGPTGRINSAHDRITALSAELVKFAKAVASDFGKVKSRTEGVMRYRGVHQRADAYSKGDAVTSDGSLWVALRETSGVKPGTSDDFQLVAKGSH